MLVENLDGSLEAGELHHGVGDLPAPQRPQGLVEPVDALFGPDLGGGGSQGGREGSDGAGLDAHLGGLHGRQRDVGEELGGGRGSLKNDKN